MIAIVVYAGGNIITRSTNIDYDNHPIYFFSFFKWRYVFWWGTIDYHFYLISNELDNDWVVCEKIINW
jgi:hypothetical protein